MVAYVLWIPSFQSVVLSKSLSRLPNAIARHGLCCLGHACMSCQHSCEQALICDSRYDLVIIPSADSKNCAGMRSPNSNGSLRGNIPQHNPAARVACQQASIAAKEMHRMYLCSVTSQNVRRLCRWIFGALQEVRFSHDVGHEMSLD